jgi:Protein of unknown function (DUF1579)
VSRPIGFIAMCVLVLGVSIHAQTPAGPPKPGPEIKRLAYFTGTWKEEGEAKPGAMGPGGKVSAIAKWEWMPGGFFVVGHSDMSPGNGKALMIMGWDANKKMYTYQSFASNGETTSALGTVSGETWTWTADTTTVSATFKIRVTIKEMSKTQQTFKMEYSTDGTTWATGVETTVTKVTSAPSATPAKKN